MKLEKSLEFANMLLERIAPACERVEIVGSNKRKDKDDVHDIEMLVIAKDKRPVPEFGKPNNVYTNMLEKVLADLQYEDILKTPFRKADGQKYKKRAICNTGEPVEFCLDLFIVTPKTWGIQNVIRTGPGIFSHRFVTNQNALVFDRELQRTFKGLLPNDLKYVKDETVIMRGDVVLELPEESDAIELLGYGWIEPRDRRKVALT